jgi:glycosyltransferase involved in cell wall biosynthesis
MVLTDAAKPEVVFIQRKPRSVGNYSIEFIFNDVRKRLQNRIVERVLISEYESNGLFKRFMNCMQAWRGKGEVNHVTGDVNYLGLFLSKRHTIQTILDCVHLNNASGLKYKILKWFWLVIPEKHARFITAISESTKQEILRHHACDPEKIIVIPVAISDKFKYVPATFNKDNPRVLQVGTAPNKNIPSLIRALKDIPCTLNIVGKQNPEYEQMLKDNGIQYVYEWGLTDEGIMDRYKKADIVSLISTYEGFGMPILEAQATGRAVITSKLFSMPEVAGDSAITVDPLNIEEIREAFLRIINDDHHRALLIQKGLENIRRFDPDTIAEKYLELYLKINSELCAE